jgi:hypothetical protein
VIRLDSGGLVGRDEGEAGGAEGGLEAIGLDSALGVDGAGGRDDEAKLDGAGGRDEIGLGAANGLDEVTGPDVALGPCTGGAATALAAERCERAVRSISSGTWWYTGGRSESIGSGGGASSGGGDEGAVGFTDFAARALP